MLAQGGHGGRGGGEAEQVGRDLVDLGVEGLGGEHDGDQEGERVGVVEEGVGGDGVELAEGFVDEVGFAEHGDAIGGGEGVRHGWGHGGSDGGLKQSGGWTNREGSASD